MLSTQVDLGSMTPEVATQPPVFPASNDFLSAQGLITHANTDHPTIPTTGSTDQAQTLPTRGRKHRRQEATLEPTQFDLLQTKLGGFTHTSAPHLSQPNLKNVNDLLTFVKTQGTSFAHLAIMGHQPRFKETLRKLNKLRRENPTFATHLTFIVPCSPNATWWEHIPGKQVQTFWTNTGQHRPITVFSTVDQFDLREHHQPHRQRSLSLKHLPTRQYVFPTSPTSSSRTRSESTVSLQLRSWTLAHNSISSTSPLRISTTSQLSRPRITTSRWPTGSNRTPVTNSRRNHRHPRVRIILLAIGHRLGII